MKGRVGCPTTIITPFPRRREPAKLETTNLSARAKFRLKIFDRHRDESPRFSAGGKPSASLTCRHFGIHRSYFHRWDKRMLSTLEDRPTAPRKRREPSHTRELARKVREIRKADPTRSAKKIRPILLRTEPEASVPSVATIGRLIAREGLFFRADARMRRKQSEAAKKARVRKRKPYNLPEGEAEKAEGQAVRGKAHRHSAEGMP